jgi:two-component system, cell cycle sensor histidine kinase and response regulator CckA
MGAERGTPLHVLILGANASDALLMERELARGGFAARTTLAKTRAELLAGLDRGPDLVLADYSLPGLDAPSALSLLQERRVDIPFIVVAGSMSEEAAVACMKQGAADYVLKGRLIRLGPAVRRALEERRLRGEKRAAEEALRESEEKYRLLTTHAGIGIGYWSPDGRLLLLNELAARHMHVPAHALLGRHAREVFDPPMAEAIVERIAAAAADDRAREYEDEVALPGGSTWFLSTYKSVRGADGTALGVQILSHDITARKEQDRVHRELATAIEHTPFSILVTDAEGRITFANPAFQLMTGFSRAETLGKSPAQLIRSGEHDDGFYRAVDGAPPAGRLWRGRIVNRRRDGTAYQEEKIIAPIFDEEGRFGGSVEIGRDVTQEVELEARLAQSQKVEALGQLAGGVAHDFNNMLQVISGYVEVLSARGAVAPESRPYLDEIRRASERAGRLTQQLLVFSRRQALALKALDPNEAVAAALKMIQRVIGEHISLTFLPAAHLPAVTADAGQLDQVLLNLCLNARDAMPGGGTLVIETSMDTLDAADAHLHPWATPGRHVCLTVTDTGHGMEPAVMARMFEPFFTTKEAGKGTGLGLATAFMIVKQHRGIIRAESSPGKGARFRVLLPARESDAAESLARPDDGPAPGGTETILLAEDDEAIRRLAVRTLEEAGYTVLVARDGEEAVALQSARRTDVGLAIVDVVMPKLGGREAAARMRELCPDLPVLFVSGYGPDAAVTRAALAVPGSGLVLKPFNLKELLRLVRRCIERRCDGGRADCAHTAGS